ncbi:hypothetical protein Tco_1563955 [Tanacetum coccineum]
MPQSIITIQPSHSIPEISSRWIIRLNHQLPPTMLSLFLFYKGHLSANFGVLKQIEETAHRGLDVGSPTIGPNGSRAWDALENHFPRQHIRNDHLLKKENYRVILIGRYQTADEYSFQRSRLSHPLTDLGTSRNSNNSTTHRTTQGTLPMHVGSQSGGLNVSQQQQLLQLLQAQQKTMVGSNLVSMAYQVNLGPQLHQASSLVNSEQTTFSPQQQALLSGTVQGSTPANSQATLLLKCYCGNMSHSTGRSLIRRRPEIDVRAGRSHADSPPTSLCLDSTTVYASVLHLSCVLYALEKALSRVVRLDTALLPRRVVNGREALSFRRGSDTAYLLLFMLLTIILTVLLQLFFKSIMPLSCEFSMTDLGPLNYFLGMLTCNPCRTPVLTRILRFLLMVIFVMIPTLYRSLAAGPSVFVFHSARYILCCCSRLGWVPQPVGLPPVIVFFLATIYFCGLQRGKLPFLAPVLKLSIGVLLMTLLKLVGYVIFYEELHFAPLSTLTLRFICDNVSAVYLSSTSRVQHQRTKEY